MWNYYESAEGIEISRSRALKELSKHGVPENLFGEFFVEVGDRDFYDAQEVLRYLGY